MLQEILPKRNKAKEHSYNESIDIQFAIKNHVTYLLIVDDGNVKKSDKCYIT